MLHVKKTFAAFAITALSLSCLPAKALTVTTPIQNTPQTLNTTGPTGLQFATFNATNFPAAFAGLLPNEILKLTNIRFNTKGTAMGTFDVLNDSTTATVPVSSGIFSYNVIANNVPSVLQTPSMQAGLTNTTGTVPVASAGSLSLSPVICTPPATPQTIVFGGTTFYYCQTPGKTSFTLNQPNTSSNDISWSIAPATGQTNPVASNFWTNGSSLSLNSQIAFTPDPTKFPGGTLSPTNPLFTFLLSNLPADTFLTYDYEKMTMAPVPAPLPLIGAGFAFGFSRRLRRRIKSTGTIAS